jgi:protein TonB
MMMGVRGCRRCLWSGLLFSAIIHAAIATVLLRARTPVSAVPKERVVNLDLALFGAGEDGAPSAAHATSGSVVAVDPSDPALVQSPQSEPAPEPSRNDNPAPDAKTTPTPVVRPPTPVKAPARRAPPTPISAPAQPSVKPKPMLVSRPAPKTLPPAKPSITASQPASQPDVVPGRRTQSESTTSAEGTTQRPGTERRGTAAGDSTAARAASEREYLIALQQAIARHQTYPLNARRREQTGLAMVSFVVRADGRIEQIRLAQGSGQSALDRAALDALRRLDCFKPIPQSIGRQSWMLRVPIRFDLK